MTGFGDAQLSQEELTASAEIRSVNNRYLKLNLRLPDGFGSLEGEIEQLVRTYIKRGTIQINLRIQRAPQAEDYRINQPALESYWAQLQLVAEKLQQPLSLAELLQLPGVVLDNRDKAREVQEEWPLVQQLLRDALENLQQMRRREGEAMARDLEANLQEIAEHLTHIEARAPLVVEAYRQRLHERVSKILEERGVQLEPADLIKEVSIFADRSDIAEECVRLRSHLEQYRQFLQAKESSGRKLDFLTQEMFRETNTIGSKANDYEIAQKVVEIKTAIERIREMVQNIE